MIHSISYKNFYSFGEEAELSFVVNENAPKNNGYFTAPSGVRLSKVEAVVGPNASGKTNLLKTIPFIKWMLVDSFDAEPSEMLPVQSFVLEGYKKQPTELSVVFEVNSKVYNYTFELNKERVLSEELKITSFSKEKKSTKRIFFREWNDAEKKYSFDGNGFGLPKGFENSLRTNASVIAVAVRFNHQESMDIINFWQKFETNVSEAGWNGGHFFPSRHSQVYDAITFFSDNEPLKKEAERLLSRFDLGLDLFEITKQKIEGRIVPMVRTSHTFGDKKESLQLSYESAGTLQLFVLLKHMLKALSEGGTVVLDEIDVNLHPDMLIALHDLFIDPEMNQGNAQMLFSSHSHLILSKLDKYQIILVEKNKEGMSESWRLDEMTGVRSDDNYYTKYITGAYGATPKL